MFLTWLMVLLGIVLLWWLIVTIIAILSTLDRELVALLMVLGIVSFLAFAALRGGNP